MKKMYAVLSIVAVLSMLLTACVMPSSAPAAPAAPASGEATAPGSDQPIELLYMTHNHPQSIPVNEAIIAEFEASHPNVKITFDNAPHANYEQKVLTAFAGGTGPDVFWAGDWMVPQFLESGIIAPVEPTAFGVETQDEFLALFPPGALDAFTADGKVYTGGVSEYNSFSLIYDKDAFIEAGIEPPSKDTPLTWEELADIAAKLSKVEDGKVIRTGLSWDFNTSIWTVLVLEPMLRQLGGELINPETGQPDFTSQAMVDLMTYIQGLTKTQAVDPAVFTDLLQDLANGRTAMIFGGPWAAKPLSDLRADLNWDTAPLPQFADAKSRVTTLYAWAWFVSGKSSPEKQKAAWEFVNLLTSKQQEWWDKVGYVQARQTEIAGLPMAEYYAKSDPRISAILDDYQYGKYEFRSTGYFELSDIWTRALSRVLTGEDVTRVLADAQQQADAAFQ